MIASHVRQDKASSAPRTKDASPAIDPAERAILRRIAGLPAPIGNRHDAVVP
jgi:hypothetical protein